MEGTNSSCNFTLVWSDMPRHTQSVDEEQTTNISVTSWVIVSSFCIKLGIHRNFELIMVGVIRHDLGS